MNEKLRFERHPPEEFNETITRLYSKEEDGSDRHCRQVTFQVTEDCCMACTYCYQHHKTVNAMSWDMIKPFLDDLLQDRNELINTKTSLGLVMDFIGGEPLMQIKLIN